VERRYPARRWTSGRRWAIRSLFDALDGIDQLADELANVSASIIKSDDAARLRRLKLFLSPDGKAARMIITHDVDPATSEGISHVDAIRHAA
jgi:uncharacterized membrane protein YdfJ with MMPL/SSD domain